MKSDFKMCENYISVLDKRYPDGLKNIYDPPRLLFYRGNIDLLKNNNLVTMVGSRQTTDYHIQSAKNIIYALQNTNLVIVSGLAKGMDSICHRQALENNLKTIAVLPSGLNDDVIYPRQNLSLAHDILKNDGLLLSEQKPSEKPNLYHFPKRNRILAGLSKATIVISGATKSGTLITAQVALDEGREVLAIPGDIDNQFSEGANNLIKEGATLLNSVDDILKIYNT